MKESLIQTNELYNLEIQNKILKGERIPSWDNMTPEEFNYFCDICSKNKGEF